LYDWLHKKVAQCADAAQWKGKCYLHGLLFMAYFGNLGNVWDGNRFLLLRDTDKDTDRLILPTIGAAELHADPEKPR
jgi:hypothetical protein